MSKTKITKDQAYDIIRRGDADLPTRLEALSTMMEYGMPGVGEIARQGVMTEGIAALCEGISALLVLDKARNDAFEKFEFKDIELDTLRAGNKWSPYSEAQFGHYYVATAQDCGGQWLRPCVILQDTEGVSGWEHAVAPELIREVVMPRKCNDPI